MSKDLVTIQLDCDIAYNVDSIAKKEIKTEALIHFYQDLDLHVFVKKMEIPVTKKEVKWDHIELKSVSELEGILEKNLSMHFEFSDYNYHKAELWGIGLSDGKNNYVVSADIALSSIGFDMYLKDERYQKYVYDLKAIKVFLLWNKLDIKGTTFDLLLAAYLINSHLGKEEFKRIVSNFYYEDIQYDDTIYGKGSKKGLPEKQVYYHHIASKSKAIYALKDELLKTLKEDEQLDLLKGIELPLSEVLAEMEYEGLRVDKDELSKQKKDLNTRIIQTEKQIIRTNFLQMINYFVW